MYSKVKEEWKTYNEMNAWEQMDFRRMEGWITYKKRRNGNRVEYLVETWKKDEE